MAANVALTATAVVAENHSVKTGIAGEALNAGEFVYLKASDGRLYKAQSDGTAEEAAVIGIALSTVPTAGQYVTYTDSGDITSQASSWSSVAEVLYLGTTAGRASEQGQEGPPASSQRVTFLGYTITTSKFRLAIQRTGLQIAA